MRGGNDLTRDGVFMSFYLTFGRFSMSRARSFPKERLWKGFLFRLTAWVDHRENLLHYLLRKWTWDSDFRLYMFIDVKVLLHPRFVIRVWSSCPFVWYQNVDVNSKEFVNYLMLYFFNMVHLFGRMRVGLVLWLFVREFKVGLQERETHDGGSFQALSIGYSTASFFFTNGQLGSSISDMFVKSLEGHFPF
ncbi:hypothetical protein V6N12_003674 [Hibiscus sabdariffa]|uniref:Uncharacterized protein n=1 Tax=Hibiscus sabdariffa TaxID=183260 RepID=A0ABR2AMS5_9ROSI